MIVRRIMITALLLVGVVSMGVALWTRHQLTLIVVPRELERVHAHADLLAGVLENRTQAAAEDAVAIAGTEKVRDIARRGASSDGAPEALRRSLEDDFRAQLLSKGWILQLRVISAEGDCMELVRVDREAPGATVRVVERALLQPKGHRPYAVAGRALGPGETYLSDLELNEEFGAVTRPLLPVARAVAPVVDGGSTVGMVVINVDMNTVLDELVSAEFPGSRVYVVDANGNYISHPDDADAEFAVALGTGMGWEDDFSALVSGDLRKGVVRAPGGRVGAAIADTTLNPGVRIIETAPYAEITASAVRAQYAALTVGVVALLGTLMCVGVLAAWIVRPFKRMASVVESFGETGWDLDRLPRQGEFGIVADAFGHFARTIEERTRALESEVEERSRVEEELRAQVAMVVEAEERFRLVVEASPNGLCVVDQAGKIVLVNREMEKMFGYSRAELMGMNVDNLVPLEARGAHREHRRSYMARPEARRMGAGRDLNARRKDGSGFPVEIGLNPVTQEGRSGVLASVVDITDRRREEAALESYAWRLERSNRALEKFAYVVSHDIKAPLRGISSVATWIAEDFGPVVDDDARENLTLLLERTARLGRLIDGILEYSRAGRETDPLEQVDTNDVIDDVIRSIELPPGVVVRTEGELPLIKYNDTKLRQVFQNLIDNAAKHLGKPIGIINVSCEETDDAWAFEVRDDGVGIPERHFERIFELFQTLRPKDETGTTGAGLAITKRIVESFGGTIRVVSKEGEGASFIFTVPFEPTRDHTSAFEQASPE